MDRLISFLVAPPGWWFRMVDALAASASLAAMWQAGVSGFALLTLVCSLLLLATGASALVYYRLVGRLRVAIVAASLRKAGKG
jgi:hypothetical protein